MVLSIIVYFSQASFPGFQQAEKCVFILHNHCPPKSSPISSFFFARKGWFDESAGLPFKKRKAASFTDAACIGSLFIEHGRWSIAQSAMSRVA